MKILRAQDLKSAQEKAFFILFYPLYLSFMKGLKNEMDNQNNNNLIEEEPDLEPLSLVKDASKNSQCNKLSLKKNISQFLQ